MTWRGLAFISLALHGVIIMCTVLFIMFIIMFVIIALHGVIIMCIITVCLLRVLP